MKLFKGFVVFVAMSMTALMACGADSSSTVQVATAGNAVPGQGLSQALQPEVNESYVYYDIFGDNETDLRRQMTQNGIKWDDGKTYDALTTWNVKWYYDYYCTTEGCTARSFLTKVDITFRYPRWQRPENPPETLAAKWDNYMANLIIHEIGHRDLAVEATAELAEAVAALKAPDRAELDRQITALADQRMTRMNSDEREYDATTVHGSTQGAVFP